MQGGVKGRFGKEGSVVRFVSKEDKSGGCVKDGLERLRGLERGVLEESVQGQRAHKQQSLDVNCVLLAPSPACLSPCQGPVHLIGL